MEDSMKRFIFIATSLMLAQPLMAGGHAAYDKDYAEAFKRANQLIEKRYGKQEAIRKNHNESVRQARTIKRQNQSDKNWYNNLYLRNLEAENRHAVTETRRAWNQADAHRQKFPMHSYDQDFTNPEIDALPGMIAHTAAIRKQQVADARTLRDVAAQNQSDKDWYNNLYLNNLEAENRYAVTETHRDWQREDAHNSVKDAQYPQIESSDFANPEIGSLPGMVEHTAALRRQQLAEQGIERATAREAAHESAWLKKMHNNQKGCAAQKSPVASAPSQSWARRLICGAKKQIQQAYRYVCNNPKKTLAALGVAAGLYYVGKKVYAWWNTPKQKSKNTLKSTSPAPSKYPSENIKGRKKTVLKARNIATKTNLAKIRSKL
jgi:hypothetical protein